MGKTTIEWTDYTFNPWHGCFKVSEGCKHCYAETLSKRFGRDIWGPASTTERRFFGEKHWSEPYGWQAQALAQHTRFRVFCASMADVFEEHPQLPPHRQKLWNLIHDTPQLDWLLLTKRPENVATMVPTAWMKLGFPDNVQIGTSVENQERAEERVPLLLPLPARVHFLSCEPLLEYVYLQPHWLAHLEWVIAGAESGPGARPMNRAWVRSLRDQCQTAKVAFFFKQDATNGHKIPLPMLDGKVWNEFPMAVGGNV